jgi:hypothetical protein
LPIWPAGRNPGRPFFIGDVSIPLDGEAYLSVRKSVVAVLLALAPGVASAQAQSDDALAFFRGELKTLDRDLAAI